MIKSNNKEKRKLIIKRNDKYKKTFIHKKKDFEDINNRNISSNQKANNNYSIKNDQLNCSLYKKKKFQNYSNIDTINAPIKNSINNVKIMQPLSQMYNNKNVSNKSGSVISKQLINRLGGIKKESRYANGAIGLVNIGSTCYLNSALQNLKNIYPLTLYLLENCRNFDKFGFTFKFCELIANLINQKDHQYFEPKEFFFKLSDMAPIFRFGEQNDSNFCIIYILNFLEKETRKLCNSYKNIKPFLPLTKEEYENFESFINKLYNKRNSYIIDLFYGFQEDISKCGDNKCKYYNYSFQGFSVLNLSIMKHNNEPILTLEEAIKYYQNINAHNEEQGLYCPVCLNKIILTKSIIVYFPKILIINFKRIGEKNFYNHNVEVPSNLNLYNYEYELIGFIKHIGGANTGHNIAICKNFFDNCWYVYDDSRVMRLDNSIYINNKSKNYIGRLENNDYIYSDAKPDTTNGFLFFYKKLDDTDNSVVDGGKNKIINISLNLRKC